MLEAGAEGAIVSFPDEAAMHQFARHYRSREAGPNKRGGAGSAI